MAMPVPLPNPDAAELRPRVAPASDEPIGPVSREEYFAHIEATGELYEFVGGYMYPVAGTSPNYGTVAHGAIVLNVAARVRDLAPGTNCRAYSATVLVSTPRDDFYVPDGVVACGPRPAGDDRYVTSPCLVVEVLSPSTRRFDLYGKRDAYAEIPSLQAYWIVEAAWRCVYRHWRDADGAWQFEEMTGNGVLPIPCLGGTLTLDEVYEDVEVPAEPPRPPLRRVREPDAEYAFESAGDEGAAAPTH